jgi:hypothetical protein
MPTNQVFEYADRLSVAPTNPLAVVNEGDPVRYGSMTGVALTLEGAGGNPAGVCTVDFGQRVWDLSVTDGVGGGIAVGDTLFYADGAPGTITNTSGANYFFGFALEAVGVGATATIRVLHVPSPGAGTLGAGTVATANLAAGILSADAAGRAKMAASFFNSEATVDSKFDAGTIGEDRLAQQLNGRAASNVADANVIGGLPVLFRIDCPDAAQDNDIVSTHKVRVIDAWGLNTGVAAHAATDTWQVKNGANAISDAVAKTATVNAVKRIGTIDPAQAEIAAGGTLRVTTAKGAGALNAAVTVYVLAIRVA